MPNKNYEKLRRVKGLITRGQWKLMKETAPVERNLKFNPDATAGLKK